jgi:ribose 5-phosphate isomerase B
MAFSLSQWEKTAASTVLGACRIPEALIMKKEKAAMKIGFGCDHAGVELKQTLMDFLKEMGHECVDYGNYDPNDRADDYPEFGRKVGEAIMRGEVEKGVLICGTGVGISLAANKIPGIRACVCSEPYSARMSVQHNNANIISLGARVVGRELAKEIVSAFFNSEFEGVRHARRVQMITDIEETYSIHPRD